MTRNDSQRFERDVPTPNRRQALAGLSAVAFAGSGVAYISDDSRANANVQMDGLSIPDAEFTAKKVEPKVRVTVGYDYDAAMEPVNALGFTLSVGGSVVAEDKLVTDRTTLKGDTELSGRVTDSEEWSSSDFAPEVASSVSRELTVGVTFDVLDSRDESIVGDTASTTAEVTVSHPQKSKYTATVGGQGEIVAPDSGQ